jgi:Mg-chelatase subunit ChlD
MISEDESVLPDGTSMTQVKAIVTLTPPTAPSGRRVGADICCVVDVSGSMGADATMKNDAGVSESDGLSLLDIVKHAIATIIHTLKAEDRLAIVAYSTKARTVLPLTDMNNRGSATAMLAVKALASGGQTNLWDGLKTGLDLLRSSGADAAADRNASLLLLTDGLPNMAPPRGEIAMLKRYLATMQSSTTKSHIGISTFGFGYSLDSPLLREIANEGEGAYSFIPDSSLVGTVFVHALANALAVSSTQARVRLTPVFPGARFVTGTNVLLGGHRCIEHSDDTGMSPITVCPGMLIFGQSKDIVASMLVPTASLSSLVASSAGAVVSASLNCIAAPNPKVQVVVQETPSQYFGSLVSLAPGDIDTLHGLQHQICRLSAVDAIRKAVVLGSISDFDGARAACDEVITLIESTDVAVKAKALMIGASSTSSATSSTPGYRLGPKDRTHALLLDLHGQVTEALSRPDWFKKWGRHYLPSLMQAHLLQLCNNFKDPGVQMYGSALFEKIRDAGDEVFCALPAPIPAPRPHAQRRSHGVAARSSAPRSMSSYHRSAGPCFEGRKVLLANGITKRVDEIQKGDKVALTRIGESDGNHHAVVSCIVRTHCANGYAELVEIPSSGLLVTPWHPVLNDEGCWTFPASMAPPRRYACAAVYSFLLGPEVSGHCTEIPFETETTTVLHTKVRTTRASKMVINDTTVITLAHNVRDDDVASHSYWGTAQVVEDLERFQGWDSGLIQLKSDCIVRDDGTGLACGLKQ